MSDGTIEIDLEVNGDKAVGQAERAAAKAAKATESFSGAFTSVNNVASGIASTFSTIAVKAAKAFSVIGGASAVATGVVVNGSLEQYSAYEQNIGGIKKLFGDAWTTVQKDADDAWKESQQSANSYMETVTGFSASLISSLGGDTQKAAQYAKTAMGDMADNANTFGTSMEDITNAYQGFAKQNYTMLDNLKLGYGGTKEEMQRLIQDAAKVNSAVDANSMSFDNIVLAIHTMQEEMDIAGTSSREALGTIEGSINATKAAWDNWLAGLADPNADMGALTENLLTAISAVGENVLPRIAQIVAVVITQLPSFMGRIGQAIQQAIPLVLDKVKETTGMSLPQLFESILQSISANLPVFFQSVGAFLMTQGPTIVGMIVSLATFLLEAIGQLGLMVIQNLPTIITGIFNLIIMYGPQLLNTALTFFMNMIVGLIQALPQILTALGQGIAQLLQYIIDHGPEMLSRGAELFLQLVGAIGQALPQILLSVGGLIGDILGKLVTLGPSLLLSGAEAFGKFLSGIVSKEGGITSFVGKIPGKIVRAIGNCGRLLYNAGRNILAGLYNGLVSMWNKVTSFVGGIASWIVRHKGPLSYDLKLLQPAGTLIMKGFNMKLVEGFDDTKKSIGDFNDELNGYGGELSTSFSPNVVRSFQPQFVSQQGAGGGQTVNQTINFNQPVANPADMARTVHEYNTFGVGADYGI